MKTTIISILFFFIHINFSLAEKVSIIYVIENIPITNVTIGNEIKYLLLINDLYKSIITAGTHMASSIKVAEADNCSISGTSHQCSKRHFSGSVGWGCGLWNWIPSGVIVIS